MTFDQALERAKQEYYGEEQSSKQTQTKKESIMTREQLESMTKQELNVALTEYMGGFADLKHTSKKEMVDLLMKHRSEAVTKPKASKSKKSGPGVIEVMVSVLESGKVTKDQILEKLVEAFPDREPEKMVKTIGTQLSRLKTKHNLNKEKSEDGPFVYWIETR